MNKIAQHQSLAVKATQTAHLCGGGTGGTDTGDSGDSRDTYYGSVIEIYRKMNLGFKS